MRVTPATLAGEFSLDADATRLAFSQLEAIESLVPALAGGWMIPGSEAMTRHALRPADALAVIAAVLDGEPLPERDEIRASDAADVTEPADSLTSIAPVVDLTTRPTRYRERALLGAGAVLLVFGLATALVLPERSPGVPVAASAPSSPAEATTGGATTATTPTDPDAAPAEPGSATLREARPAAPSGTITATTCPASGPTVDVLDLQVVATTDPLGLPQWEVTVSGAGAGVPEAGVQIAGVEVTLRSPAGEETVVIAEGLNVPAGAPFDWLTVFSLAAAASDAVVDLAADVDTLEAHAAITGWRWLDAGHGACPTP